MLPDCCCAVAKVLYLFEFVLLCSCLGILGGLYRTLGVLVGKILCVCCYAVARDF